MRNKLQIIIITRYIFFWHFKFIACDLFLQQESFFLKLLITRQQTVHWLSLKNTVARSANCVEVTRCHCFAFHPHIVLGNN